MNIIEAIKSGRVFKRPKSKQLNKIELDSEDYYTILIKDLIAEDWEIEEEKIEITKDQLKKAFAKSCCQINIDEVSIPTYDLRILAQELGFKD